MTIENTGASKKAKISIISFPVIIVVLLLASACGGSKGTASSEELQEFKELKEIVESREFAIENQWAMPMSGSMINLIGNLNKIRFKGDSVEVRLPYFGVRYSGAGYGSEGGIRFHGIPRKLSVEEDQSERKIIIKFQGQHRNESMNFVITMFPNRTTSTTVNTLQRSTISYRGKSEPHSDEPEKKM